MDPNAASGAQQQQSNAMFSQFGTAITALTSQIQLMTVFSQDTTAAVKKLEAKQEEMEKSMQQIVASQKPQHSQSRSSWMTSDVRLGNTKAINWQLGPYDATWGAQPATNADVVKIVQDSITKIIPPAIMCLTDKLENRCNMITQEIRTMAIRIAWMEQYVLKFQQDLARTQLVIRSWPDKCTVGDRTATVTALVEVAGLAPNIVKLAHPVYWGENDEEVLGPVSIITFYIFTDRKTFQGSIKDGKFAMLYKNKAGVAVITKKKLKVILGITTFERRLEAPLQAS
ncbi:unnamed protein product [Polarella glacialis]|uniref:Uncharacterized protein n=2 Tax=Polarella glacialis TaxID=89957 RepID=A0A813JBQ9_POLGL|nr:unnamed protein product [Polarella glacialis]